MKDTDKFKNKYRINSTRLKYWDYSKPGYYFVTICTKDKQPYLGEIEKSKVVLSEIGKIAKECWKNIPRHFSFIKLDEFVIMPNHMHGIVIIDNDANVETCHGMSLPKENFNKFSRPISNSLSTVINQFKGSVKRECNEGMYNDFSWQPKFYDHIIRNETELYNVRRYILENPIKWEMDEYYL